jgi:Homeodomain-like domain
LLTCLLYRFLCGFVGLLARRGGERELEIVVLRHQVAILRRGGRRPQYTTADRALLAAASRLLVPERWSCFAVRPQTLRRWHRTLLQGNRRRRGRPPGRPPLAAETRSLILRMARENPRWGYMRIQGELLKLGISVSATTVANVLRASGLGPAPRRIGPSWSEFMRAQAQSMLGGGLRSEPAREFEGNVAARSAPPPKGTAGGVKAKEHATNGAEQPCSSPVRGLPRLSPGAAVPFLNDSTAAPLRSSQQWHARDGPSARDGPRTHRRSLHARTLRSPFQSKPSAARAGARRRNHGLALPERGCETLHPAAAARGNERGAEPAVEPSFLPHSRKKHKSVCRWAFLAGPLRNVSARPPTLVGDGGRLAALSL